MPDVDELIRGELTRLVDRAPMAPSVRDVEMPRATARPRRRHRAIVALAAVTATVAIAGATVIAVTGRDGDGRQPGQVRATSAGPAFVETVDWPHFLATAPPDGAELQLVQEIRPGGLPSWTTQSFRVGDAGGSILLTVQPFPEDPGDGPLDATGETVQGHPLNWFDDQDSPNVAAWSWPGAHVLVHVDGLDRSAATGALDSLIARNGDPAAGFDPHGDGNITLNAEHLASGGQPAISRAWYGTEDRTDLEVQAAAPVSAVARTIDLVSISGDGTSDRRTVAGRDALVATSGAWTTVAWYEADGTFVSVHARDLADVDLERLVGSIQRVDQPAWDAAVSDASARIAARLTGSIEFREFTGARLVARDGRGSGGEVTGSDLCLELADQSPACAANLGRRDGGPYVVGPAGVLSWTPIEAESAIADFVVEGEWWVGGRLSRSQSPGVETEAGPVETQVVESGGATWFLARLPNDADRYVLTAGGSVTAGWRPSGGR